ncbi:unnamed protein product, partial [Tenebrio molitor]
ATDLRTPSSANPLREDKARVATCSKQGNSRTRLPGLVNSFQFTLRDKIEPTV